MNFNEWCENEYPDIDEQTRDKMYDAWIAGRHAIVNNFIKGCKDVSPELITDTVGGKG